MMTSEHSSIAASVKAQQLWLPAEDLHKFKPVNILA